MSRMDDSSSATPVTLVLVTDQIACQRLIAGGRQLADEQGTHLGVVNVTQNTAKGNPKAIEYLYQISKDHDATMMIYYSAQPMKRLTEIIAQQAPANIVTGLPHGEHSVLYRLWVRFRQTHFFVVEEDGNLSPIALESRVPTHSIGNIQRRGLYENPDDFLSFF